MIKVTKAQRDAAWCWYYSKVQGKSFDKTQRPGRLKIDLSVTREDVIQKCDELLVTSDPSVQIMVLRALRTLQVRTRHIGFVAALTASRELGMSFDYPRINFLRLANHPLSKGFAGYYADTYLSDILDLRDINVRGTLEDKNTHWLQCLKINKLSEDTFGLETDAGVVKRRNQETLARARNDITAYLNLIVNSKYPFIR